MSLGVHVDVPFSGREILRLLGCECRLSLDGIFGRAAFPREPDLRRSVLALGDGPGDYTRRRIVRQLSHPHTGRLQRRYLLGAYQWDLKGLGCAKANPPPRAPLNTHNGTTNRRCTLNMG